MIDEKSNAGIGGHYTYLTAVLRWRPTNPYHFLSRVSGSDFLPHTFNPLGHIAKGNQPDGSTDCDRVDNIETHNFQTTTQNRMLAQILLASWTFRSGFLGGSDWTGDFCLA
jgi:hypothetical protein